MKTGSIIVITSALLLLGGLAMQARDYIDIENSILDVDYQGEVSIDLEYGEAESNKYDLYLPEDISSEKARHLVLFIHGGAWVGGDKAEGEKWCRNLANLGYTTASMNYSLKTGSTDTNVKLVNEEVRSAVTAIMAKCSELGIELKDMALNGFSAGACQAMYYGFKEKDDSPLEVRFIIQESGPTTFEPEVWFGGSIGRLLDLEHKYESYAQWLSLMSGEVVTVDMVKDGSAEEIWRNVSPCTYIEKGSVPICFAYGALDGIVPPESRMVLENALDEAGVPYKSLVLSHSGHGLRFDISKNKEFLAMVHQFCETYFIDDPEL